MTTAAPTVDSAVIAGESPVKFSSLTFPVVTNPQLFLKFSILSSQWSLPSLCWRWWFWPSCFTGICATTKAPTGQRGSWRRERTPMRTTRTRTPAERRNTSYEPSWAGLRKNSRTRNVFFFILPSVFEEGGYFLHTGWREKSLKQQKR